MSEADAVRPTAGSGKLPEYTDEVEARRLARATSGGSRQMSIQKSGSTWKQKWYDFTTGYAFEVVILRDLSASGVDFQAHDLRDRHARQSPFDLVVLGSTGDLKTSTYFLHTIRMLGLLADFYITQLYDPRSRQRRVVVFLKRPAWEAIDGEAQPTTLVDLPNVMPTVAEITHDRQSLIVVDYPEWKARVLRRQRWEKE